MPLKLIKILKIICLKTLKNLQMLKDDKNNKIELIKPMNEKSSVANSNLGIHHLAFTTDNEEEFLRLLKENKFGKIFTPYIEAPGYRCYILSLHSFAQNFDNTNQMSSVFMYIGLHFILFNTEF